MRYVTQLIIHISHFVRVARRSNGLQPYRLSALVHVWNAELFIYIELLTEVGAPFSRRTPRTSCT